MSLTTLKQNLKSYSSLERKKSNERFFKTDKGQYGEGDKFIGVSMPNAHKVANHFKDLTLPDTKKLLYSPIHEERMVALLILVDQFKKGDEKTRKKIFEFYLQNNKHINNWDLVDTSAPKIIGNYVLKYPKEKSVIIEYSKSKNLWKKRIAIVGTLTLIQGNQFDLTMQVTKTLLSDSHDLTHKAIGWMLREVWKRDHKLVENFLKVNYDNVPRTTLRYTIERMPEPKRLKFLKGIF